MKNLFSAEYALQLETTKNYKAAKAANDEAGMEAARAAHMEQEARIEAMGTTFSRLYDRYVSAQERGNAYIDWDDVIWDNHVEGFVASLRECGIERFVFSSGWSSAVETAWKLQQCGCKLEGLVEINGRSKSFDSDDYDKIHGYLFSL